MPNDLVGQRGELRATISVTRKETGKVEFYDLVGFADPADLDKFLADQSQGLNVQGSASLNREVDPADLIDQAAIVDQDAVTSTVAVDGRTTVRTYSDGAMQEQVWQTAEAAQAYAHSVNEEGN